MNRRLHAIVARLRTSLSLLFLTSGVAAVAGESPFPCTRNGPNVLVHQADLPAGLLKALPFDMADPGQPFETTDVPSFPRRPNHRLICAYPNAGGYVIEWEFGGIVHNRRSASFRSIGDAWQPQ